MSIATSEHEQILQGCRAWLKLAGSPTPLTDAQVIPSDDKGTRPPLPYLTVHLTASDIPTATDQPVVFLGDQVVVTDGATGTIFTLVVNGTTIAYTKPAESLALTTAAIVALINAMDLIYAEVVSASTFWIASLHGDLVVTEADSRLALTVGGAVVEGILGQRAANLSVQGFGDATRAWLERAVRRLQIDAVSDVIDAAGLSIVPTGGMSRVSALIDTAIEGRFLREFEVTYAVRTEPILKIPLEVVEVTSTYDRYAGDPDAFTTVVEVEVS